MVKAEQACIATQPELILDADNRRHPRFLCVDGGVLKLSIRPEFKGRRAMLVDISVAGIGFLLEDAVPAHTVLVFELQGPNGTDTISRIARVRHCRKHPVPADAPWLPAAPLVSQIFRALFGAKEAPPPGDAWLVGCEFDCPLNDEELKQTLERLTALRDCPV